VQRLVCSFVKTTWYLTQALELGEQLSELEKAGPVLQVRQSSRISQILQSVSLESWRLWSRHRRSQPADVIVGYLNIIKYLQLGDSCRLIALPGARFAWSRIDGGLLADLHLISLHYKASWTHQTFRFFKPRHCLQRQAQHPLHESSQSMSLIYRLSILRTFRSCNQRMMLWTMRPLIDLSVKALNEPVRICLSCHKSAHFCALLLALEGIWARRTTHRARKGVLVVLATWQAAKKHLLCVFNQGYRDPIHPNTLGLFALFNSGACEATCYLVAIEPFYAFCITPARSDGCCLWMRGWKRTKMKYTGVQRCTNVHVIAYVITHYCGMAWFSNA